MDLAVRPVSISPTVTPASKAAAPAGPTDSVQLGSTPETVPGFPRFGVVHISAQEASTPEGREAIAQRMAAELKQFPGLTAVIGTLPAQGGNTELVVEGRPDAVSASGHQGEYEIIQRLSSSPTLKQEAAAHPVSYQPVEAFDAQGKADQIRLPGNENIAEVAKELAEGDGVNPTAQLQALFRGLPRDRPVVVLLPGPSAAGKSFMAAVLDKETGDRKIVDFPGDSYFRDADDPKLPHTANGSIFWDSPNALSLDEMAGDIGKLVTTGHLDAPTYDFAASKPGVPGQGYRVPGSDQAINMGKKDIVVIDSLHAANPAIIKKLESMGIAHVAVYIDSQTAEDRLVRRIVRDYSERGRSPESSLHDWDNSTWPGEVQFIRPTMKELDPAEDLAYINKFGADQELTRAQIDHKVATQEQYGVQPSYDAFKVSDADMPAFAKQQAARFQAVLDDPAAKPEDKQKARAGLDLLRQAPQSVLK
ncbi:MAG: uridine kinase family protein [Candidatus Xenobia bacterium]